MWLTSDLFELMSHILSILEKIDFEDQRTCRHNSAIDLRALCKKFFQKNRKTTPTDFVQNRLRIPKLYLACLSDHS